MSVPERKPETISHDRVIIPAKPENYAEVRHLILQGTQREIGFALGQYSRERLGVKLQEYADPIYGRAREEYLRHNLPSLAERAEGVAEAFGIQSGGHRYDTTSLPIGFGSFGCSAVYFPPSTTTDGHALVARNFDFYTVSFMEMLTNQPQPNEPRIGTQSFIAEFYPDKGPASIQTACFDFLNFPLDGLNEHGLFATFLVDQQGPGEPIPLVGGQDSGLSEMQVTALLMNRCDSIESAKKVLLQNRIFMPFEAIHWLIATPDGRSTIFEIDGKTGQYVFVDGKPGRPQVMTNHAVHLYPAVDTFPQVDEKAEYDTFNRYRRLTEAVNKHRGKFNVDDCFEIMSLVYGAADDAAEAGAKSAFPIRTLWTMVADLTAKTISVKYYLRDEPVDGRINLALSGPFSFRLSA